LDFILHALNRGKSVLWNATLFFSFWSLLRFRTSSFVLQSQSSANKFKKMVLHFGKTCFCLIIFPKKKTLQFTLFFVATSVFGVFLVFLSSIKKKKFWLLMFFSVFVLGELFLNAKRKGPQQTSKWQKKELHGKEHFYLSSVHEIQRSLLFGLLRAVGSWPSEIVLFQVRLAANNQNLKLGKKAVYYQVEVLLTLSRHKTGKVTKP